MKRHSVFDGCPLVLCCVVASWGVAAISAEPLHIAATYPCAQALDEVVMQCSFEPPIPRPLVIATANRNLLAGFAENRWPAIMRIATPETPVAKDELVIGRYVVRVVVHPKNPVTSISKQQLADMMLEKIESWDVLGGKPKPIRFVGPEFVSLAGHIIDQYAGPNGRYPVRWEAKVDTSEVVATVQDDPFAIGFIHARADDALGKQVRQLDVGDDPPEACTAANVYNGRWPLQVSICFRSSAKHPSLTGIARFCRTPEGAEVLSRYGVWSEANAAKVLSQERLALAADGKGDVVAAIGRPESEPILKAVTTCFIEDESPVQLSFRSGPDAESRKRLTEGAADFWVSHGDAEGDDQPRGNVKDQQSGGMIIPLARHVTVVIVNRENAIQSLSVDKLRDIYSGKTKAWSIPVGGQEAIQRLTLPGSDENAKLFLSEVLGGKPPRAATQVKTGRDVVQAVTANPRAVGYASVLDVTDDDKGVRIVPLVRDNGSPLLPKDPGYFLERGWILHVSPAAKPAGKSLAEFIGRGMADRGLSSVGLVAPRARTKARNGPALQ